VWQWAAAHHGVVRAHRVHALRSHNAASKRPLLLSFPIETQRFTKTGSGQTRKKEGVEESRHSFSAPVVEDRHVVLPEGARIHLSVEVHARRQPTVALKIVRTATGRHKPAASQPAACAVMSQDTMNEYEVSMRGSRSCCCAALTRNACSRPPPACTLGPSASRCTLSPGCRSRTPS
jgi:hypothetical protein